ncbi:protein STICHEL [Dorcoceras hygrometricum]|uniref:Protein STICHEL n=1 Tax=Dorcoceras hygrometricum TaxID=472368 RepID=A0A2Z7ADQ0_9LAMI|nr:protein STICHEL [Dorcoceras hygrometricum]
MFQGRNLNVKTVGTSPNTAGGGARRRAAARGRGRRPCGERRRGGGYFRVFGVVELCHANPRSCIYRLVMGLNRPNGPGSGPVPYEHSVQLHHRGSIIFPIDDQIGSIYTVKLRIQLAMGPQQLRLRKNIFGLTHRIMVKRLATSPHDPLGITDSACKNQSVMVSVQYGPFNTYIPIKLTTIGKSRVARDPITMHTSWRSNSDIACVTRQAANPRQRSIDSYMHRDLTQSRHLMTPTKDLGLIHSTNGYHLESPNEDSSIDHQVTIHLHAQNITMFPTNETWYFTSQILVSSSGGLILILTAQSTRNEFRIHIEALVLVAAGNKRANTRINEEEPRVVIVTRIGISSESFYVLADLAESPTSPFFRNRKDPLEGFDRVAATPSYDQQPQELLATPLHTNSQAASV